MEGPHPGAARQVLALLIKELQLLWNDRPALSLLFLMPAFFILVMSFALESAFEAGTAERPISVLVVNRDAGPIGAALVEELGGIEGFELIEREGGEPLTLERAEKLVGARRHPMAIVLGAELSANVSEGAPVAVRLIVDPATNLQLVAPLRGAVVGALERRVLLERLQPRFGGVLRREATVAAPDGVLEQRAREELDAVAEAGRVAVSIAPPRGMEGRRRPTAREQSVPAYAIFGVFFITLTLATSVIRERADGIEVRLRTAPISWLARLGGKVLPYYLLNLVQIALMFGVGVVLLSLPLGDLVALTLVSLAVAAAATGLGLLIAEISETEAQVGALAVTLTITLSALGGLLVPSFVMPAWMLTLAKLTPHYWALQGYHDAMLRGADAAGVVAEAAVLLGYATAFFGLALGRAASR